MEAQVFKSPQRKLIALFQRSRDGWKAKCKEVKRQCKKLSNQVRAVEKSRAHWREIARQEQERARQLACELERLKRAVD